MALQEIAVVALVACSIHVDTIVSGTPSTYGRSNLRMLSKNFPATHQRDADFWTGLLDIGRWGPGRHRALFTKRAVSGWGRGCRARRGKHALVEGAENALRQV